MSSNGSLQFPARWAVRVGLNLRAGQRLLIIGPLAAAGVSLEAAPLVPRSRAPRTARCATGGDAVGRRALQCCGSVMRRASRSTSFPGGCPRPLPSMSSGRRHPVDRRQRSRSAEERPPERITAIQRAVAAAAAVPRAHFPQRDDWTVVAAASAGWPRRFSARRPRSGAAVVAGNRQIEPPRHPRSAGGVAAHLDALAARRDMLNGNRSRR